MVNEEASDFRRVVGVVARNKVATFRQFVRDNEDGVEASRCTGQVHDEVCRNYVPSGGRDGQGLEMAGGTLGVGLVPLTARAGTARSPRQWWRRATASARAAPPRWPAPGWSW